MLDLDELVIAKLLYPSILDRGVIVRDPKPPFDKLPRLPQQKSDKASLNYSWSDDDNDSDNTNIHS